MGKIGILTYHDSDNFGSVLQAYALSSYLLKNGAECEIVDYRKEEVQRLYRIFQPMDSRFHVLTNLYSLTCLRKLLKRKERFEEFRQTMLPLSEGRYIDREQLKQCCYSQFIVGSDQVWNVDIIDFDPAYMLDFTEADKVSYAASFGPRGKREGKFEQYLHLFQSFRKISVREKASRDVCVNDLGVSAELVCDPVFLLDRIEWEHIARQYIKRPKHYVLCYFPGGVSQSMEHVSRELSRKMGCRRLLLMPEWRNGVRPGKKAYDCGPAEFLDLLIHADYICTTSFHGAAFSLLFQKNFHMSLNGGDERMKMLLQFVPDESKVFLKNELVQVQGGKMMPGLQKFIRSSMDYLDSVAMITV